MSPLPAGSAVPSFSLKGADDGTFTEADLAGQDDRPGLLPVRVQPGLHRPAEPVRRAARPSSPRRERRCTASPATRSGRRPRSRQQLGVEIEQLSDFEPKGAVCRAFGVYHPGGFPQRALVIIGPDATVKWSYQAESPGDLPGANLIFDGLSQPSEPPRGGGRRRPDERPAFSSDPAAREPTTTSAGRTARRC